MVYINPSTSKSSEIKVFDDRKKEFKERIEAGINGLLGLRDEFKRGNY